MPRRSINAVGTRSATVPRSGSRGRESSLPIQREPTCREFITDTERRALGMDPQVHCDDAIVNEPLLSGEVTRTTDMDVLRFLCNLGVSLACSGYERVLRHHCRFPRRRRAWTVPESPTTIREPAGTARARFTRVMARANLPAATAISVEKLRTALLAWASVCKEPDDPCRGRALRDLVYKQHAARQHGAVVDVSQPRGHGRFLHE